MAMFSMTDGGLKTEGWAAGSAELFAEAGVGRAQDKKGNRDADEDEVRQIHATIVPANLPSG
jgi:hypothetical protein